MVRICTACVELVVGMGAVVGARGKREAEGKGCPEDNPATETDAPLPI